AGTLVQVDQGIGVVMESHFRSMIAWIDLQVFFPRDIEVPGSFPYPGGWLLGSILLANLLSAHMVRFKLNWKRSGIFLTHAGLIIILLSELVTGLYAVEGNMTIEEGTATNYLEHLQHVEVAVREVGSDEVTVVAESRLKRGGVIENDLLPFDMAMHQYMPHSEVMAPGDAPSVENPANAGDGRHVVAVPRPQVTGVDPEQRIDAPSAYVTFSDKQTGQPLGTYLISLWLSVNDRPQRVTVDGKVYEVDLRFKRTYKPYTMYLADFRHDRYIGTDIPKNFSSQIRLMDPSRNVDRDVLIYMNHPLRYEGETFFQSSYKPGDTATILQVVRNPGWLMPYISCVMVAVGLIVHFGLSLMAFSRRR
ncbi:MAG: cytochrome c biogenesis protein ResB, partial [Phycisphaeraceae bacterium]